MEIIDTKEYTDNMLAILLQVGFLEEQEKGSRICRITPDGELAFNALSWYVNCGCEKTPGKE